MTRPLWDSLLSELCGGSSDPDAARLANEIEREIKAIETHIEEQKLLLAKMAISLRLINQTANENAAPIDSEAANYYAGNCQAIHELSQHALTTYEKDRK